MERVYLKYVGKKDGELQNSLQHVKYEVDIKGKKYDEDPFIKVRDEDIAKYLLLKGYRPSVQTLNILVQQDRWLVIKQIVNYFPELITYLGRLAYLSSRQKTLLYLLFIGLSLPNNVLSLQSKGMMDLYNSKVKINVVKYTIKRNMKNL